MHRLIELGRDLRSWAVWEYRGLVPELSAGVGRVQYLSSHSRQVEQCCSGEAAAARSANSWTEFEDVEICGRRLRLALVTAILMRRGRISLKTPPGGCHVLPPALHAPTHASSTTSPLRSASLSESNSRPPGTFGIPRRTRGRDARCRRSVKSTAHDSAPEISIDA